MLNIYTDQPMYNMHTKEYQMIWETEGPSIIKSFEKVLSLPFTEKTIDLLINEGKDGSNSSGESESEIMHFRYNNRCKIGTFLHELSHRIVMEHKLFTKARKIYDISDIHEVIDLFLYDVIVDLYGKEAADLRVDYESNFEEEIYKKSWESVLLLSYEERQNKLKKIIKVNLNE